MKFIQILSDTLLIYYNYENKFTSQRHSHNYCLVVFPYTLFYSHNNYSTIRKTVLAFRKENKPKSTFASSWLIIFKATRTRFQIDSIQ